MAVGAEYFTNQIPLQLFLGCDSVICISLSYNFKHEFEQPKFPSHSSISGVDFFASLPALSLGHSFLVTQCFVGHSFRLGY
jgi:hypothetical protein